MKPWGQWASYTSMKLFYAKQERIDQPIPLKEYKEEADN